MRNDSRFLSSFIPRSLTTFDDTTFFDARSTAYWALGGSGRLVAGTGLGGNGSDGAFVPTGPEVLLDTNANGGLFNFTRFVVLSGTRVIFRGALPARVRVLRLADIRGTIDLRGGDGGDSAGERGKVTMGGEAGPGAGRGGRGNPNGSTSVSRTGEAGKSAPRVSGTTNCNTGAGLRRGGGCAGLRSAFGAGSGGGGGHRDFGVSDTSSPNSGLGGVAYGDPTISDLRGGSGGGGGGNDADETSFVNDAPGGAGGGGGGALSLEVGGRLLMRGTIDASGGRGGAGLMQSGGGGGGSGGAVRLRAGRIMDITSGSLLALGGSGGGQSLPGRRGGRGSVGRIRLEDADGFVGGFVGDSVRLGFTFGASRFYDSGIATPHWTFDGADVATGALLTGPGVTDLDLPNGVPAGTKARIVFTGAPENIANPGFPDRTKEIGPVTDVTALDGLRFIRFAIRFDIGPALPVAVVPEVERLRIRFTCP